MSKAIMISIKPKWVAKILNGEKTIEIRKNKALYKATIKLIEEQGYVTFFMYCTKEEGLIYEDTYINGDYVDFRFYAVNNVEEKRCEYQGSGKVVAKFTVRKVEEIECAIDYVHEDGRDCTYHTDSMCEEVLGELSCLYNDIDEYLDWKPNNIVGGAYHIEDLVIFDEPKELSEFHKIGFNEWCAEHPPILSLLQPKKCYEELKQFMITKAPQNFCYVESD